MGSDLGAECAGRVGLLTVTLNTHMLGLVKAGVGTTVVLVLAILTCRTLVATDGYTCGQQGKVKGCLSCGGGALVVADSQACVKRSGKNGKLDTGNITYCPASDRVGAVISCFLLSLP